MLLEFGIKKRQEQGTSMDNAILPKKLDIVLVDPWDLVTENRSRRFRSCLPVPTLGAI